MPNYCSNTLAIRGRTPADLQDFLEKAKGDGEALSLQSLYPMPAELEGTRSPGKADPVLIEKFGHSNWYDWRVAKWGTKWDIADTCLEELDDTKVEIYFSSAWSPPVEWLKEIAPRFPNVKFQLQYREEGCGFEGETYAYGNTFEDDCRNIVVHSDDFDSDDWDENEGDE